MMLQGAHETSASAARWMGTNADLRMIKERAAAALPHLDSTICAALAEPRNSRMFYSVKAMRVVQILCAGLLAQAAAGQAVAGQTAVGDGESALRAGALAQEHGDLKTAIADYRRALVLKPDSIEARANLGAALAAAGELNAAIEEDSHVLEISPKNDAVRMNLAMAYYRPATGTRLALNSSAFMPRILPI